MLALVLMCCWCADGAWVQVVNVASRLTVSQSAAVQQVHQLSGSGNSSKTHRPRHLRHGSLSHAVRHRSTPAAAPRNPAPLRRPAALNTISLPLPDPSPFLHLHHHVRRPWRQAQRRSCWAADERGAAGCAAARDRLCRLCRWLQPGARALQRRLVPPQPAASAALHPAELPRSLLASGRGRLEPS